MYFKGVFHKVLFICLLLTCVVALSFSEEKKDDYDRLDGTGKSGKRVDVIEWQDNLEVHVYPAGSLAGLGLKLVTEGGKKIMVISYRFNSHESTPLIRRAVLGIPIQEGFHAFLDTSAKKDGYDKIMISNKSLVSKKIAAYKLDPEPTQLYPEGHPMLAEAEEKEDKSNVLNQAASQGEHNQRKPANSNQESKNTESDSDQMSEKYPAHETGRVRAFSW